MTIDRMSVCASFLILVIVVLRALAIHKLPKVTFLILWGTALCRLLIPFSIPSPWSIFGAFDSLSRSQPKYDLVTSPLQQVAAASAQIIHAFGQSAAAEPTHPVLILWVIGLAACASFFLITHIRFCRIYRTALPVESPAVAAWLRSHRIARTLHVRQLDRISAPLTYGVLRPVILLPKGMDLTDEQQLRCVLTHEFVHIRRFDALWKWLLAAALCVHWFNPLVWVMYILANRDMELSCDEAVVRALGAAQKEAYALTLLNLEERRSPHAPLCNNFSKNSVQERIYAIMKLKKFSKVGIAVALVLVICIVVVFATNGSHPQENINQLKAAVPQARSGSETGSANLIQSITEGEIATSAHVSRSPSDQSKGCFYRSFVIKFKQDMDASTLNAQNILAYIDENSTESNCTYNAGTKELQIDVKLDTKQVGALQNTATIQVLLSKNIKTVDGTSIDGDYIYTVANNQ